MERSDKTKSGDREKETEIQRVRRAEGWGGLFELGELKSLSFFTIETDSHNM